MHPVGDPHRVAGLVTHFDHGLLVGVCVVLVHRPMFPSTPESWIVSRTVSNIFVPLAFLIPLLLTILYENTIRRYLDLRYRQEPPGDSFNG